MAPECLIEKKYSAKSDIWAYGVTVIEILTRKEPYPEIDAVVAASNVMHKNLSPTIPQNCPPQMVDIIQLCFSRDTSQRPSFKQILAVLDVVN